MKSLLNILLLIFIFNLTNCSYFSKYSICLKSNFQGWIYLVKSSDSLKDNKFYADSKGLVYIPQAIYNSKSIFLIMVDDTLLENGKHQFYDVEFYNEDNRKIIYSKFYYPLTLYPKNEKVNQFEGKELKGFEYLYYTKILDERRLAK